MNGTTTHNQTDMDLAHEALAKFFPADQLGGVEFKQTSGGWVVTCIGLKSHTMSIETNRLDQSGVDTQIDR
jgi:hypothetical protein